MKTLLYLVLYFSIIHSFGQTWKSAYDSCIKYHDLELYKQAIEWGNKALDLYEQQVAERDTQYSDILNIQFDNYYEADMQDKAEALAKKDSAWTRRRDMQRYSRACSNLSLIYYTRSKYFEAELLLKECMNITLQIFGKNSISYATDQNNLGMIYQKQDKYKDAEQAYKEALEIAKNISGETSEDFAFFANNLAYLYQITGRYPESENLYRKVKDIFSKIYAKKNLKYAAVCNNLGGLYHFQGRYKEAELLLCEALQIRGALLPKTHGDYARCSLNLCALYQDQAKYAQAESILHQLKDAYYTLRNQHLETYSALCSKLANLYQFQGKYEEAEELLKELVQINSENKQSRPYVHYCNALATLYTEMGNYSQAKKLLKEVSENIKDISKDSPDYSIFCHSAALFYKRQGRYSEAESKYKEIIQTKMNEIENNFRNLSEEEKQQYIQANVEKYFNDFQNFVLIYYTQKPDIATVSYDLVLSTKGLILQGTEKIKNRIFNSHDEELKKMYIEWKLAKDKYAKLSLNDKKQNTAEIDSLSERIRELEKQLALRSEDFANTFIPKKVTWKDIQKSLKKNQASVEIVQINAKKTPKDKDSIVYMALILKKHSEYPQIVVLPNGNKMESEYFVNYRRCISSKLQDSQSYTIFWKPIAEALKNIQTIFFCPDGIYHQINISTLYNPQTKKYVLDEIEIINVTNTKDILNTYRVHGKNNFLIGNPKFSIDPNNKDNQKALQQRIVENLPQLEGAEKEVRKIAALLPNATVVTGIDATEEYVKSIKNPRILHIATHGYFNRGVYESSIQAMLNSGLLFAGVTDYTGMEFRQLEKEDGKLTALEVMNMELDSTELVVLSACETGLGQLSKEGVYGLQRAFKVAGAQKIIMSLWKVHDEAAQILMTKFYENWQKKRMSKQKAFKVAQKQVRKQYKEPYYWGAFVMVE